MRPEDRQAGALWDMRFYANEAINLTASYTFETWSTDDLAIYAVEHVIQHIGEAAMRLPRTFQDQQAQIDWHGIINMRHILVHRYEEIQLPRVWEIATVHAAELITLLDTVSLVDPAEVPDDLTP